MSIQFEVPNLDGASLDHKDYDELADVLRKLAGYAIRKSLAMQDRLDGHIQDALCRERAMDEIYQTLPKWARW